MRLLAPAKINLHLRVGPRDASGYHPLVTWMCTVGLFDTLTIRPSDTSSSITIRCDRDDVPRDASNLVLRAAEALRTTEAAESPRLSRGIEIDLDKHIPVSGGLGGGSSDAARTLLGLNRLEQLGLPLEQLHPLAAMLGSDVPFFLHGSSSACTGRGEVVTPIDRPRPQCALLVLSGFAVPTAEVYRRFDELRLGDVGLASASAGGDEPVPQPPWREWAALSAGPLLSRLRNDLEPATFSLVPQLGRLRDALEQSLARVIRMTGSGGTLFTLFDEPQEAEVAAQFVRTRHMLEALAVELAPTISDDLSAA